MVNQYTELGELYKQSEGPTNHHPDSLGNDLMEVTAWTDKGQVGSNKIYGNSNLTTNYQYYHTGQVAKISNANNKQQFSYDYDGWGNLAEQRLDYSGDDPKLASETFAYDDLHRLFTSRVSGQSNIQYRYDTLGNLLRKTDYTRAKNSEYGMTGNAGPNAINKLYLPNDQEINYSYDEVGNRISATKNSINSEYHYDAFNLMTYSKDNGTQNEILFRYGVDNQRYLKIETSQISDGEEEEFTIYAGPQFETIRSDIADTNESKIHVTPYMTLTHSRKGVNRHFKFQDRMGSTTLIVD